MTAPKVPPDSTPEIPALTSFERHVLDVLTQTPTPAAELVDRVGIADHQLLVALRSLERERLARRHATGLRYSITEWGRTVAAFLDEHADSTQPEYRQIRIERWLK